MCNENNVNGLHFLHSTFSLYRKEIKRNEKYVKSTIIVINEDFRVNKKNITTLLRYTDVIVKNLQNDILVLLRKVENHKTEILKD